MSDDIVERQLRKELMQMDIELRRKQIAWETPRNVAILAGAVAALAGVLGGYLGFQAARGPTPAPIIIQVPAPK